MKLTNLLNLPIPILNAISNDEYDAGDCNISITGLLEPPRIRILKQNHSHQTSEDASDRIFILLGKAVHWILEKGAKEGLIQNAIVEKRFFTHMSGWKIGGQVDLFHEGKLSDYKISTVWKFKDGKPSQEHIEQLNCYAHLLRANGHVVKSLEIVGILRDWSKNEFKRRGGDYPSRQVVVAPVPLWSDLEAIEFISKRIKMHQLAQKELPECSASDRWEKPTQYALMKKGGKRAIKLFSTLEEAQKSAWAEQGLFVENRPGELTRCDNWCSVSAFCSQYQQLKKEMSHEV